MDWSKLLLGFAKQFARHVKIKGDSVFGTTCLLDGKTLVATDFSLHSKKGKKGTFGLSKKELKSQFSKKCESKSPWHKKVEELDIRKGEVAFSMLRRAVKNSFIAHKNSKYSRKYKSTYISTVVDYKGEKVRVVFIRYNNAKNWTLLLTIDLPLSFTPAVELYQIRSTFILKFYMSGAILFIVFQSLSLAFSTAFFAAFALSFAQFFEQFFFVVFFTFP
jgi:hypothetical protein